MHLSLLAAHVGVFLRQSVIAHRIASVLLPGLLGGLIAFLGWYDAGQYGWALLLFGPLLLAARCPLRVYAAALGYYLALGWEEVAALMGYFGLGLFQASVVWVAHALFNAMPWVAALLLFKFWPNVVQGRAAGVANLVVGSAASLLPPWAGLSWGSPLFLAGALYPGSGVFGVVAVVGWWVLLGLSLLAALRRKSWVWVAMPVLVLGSSLVWRALHPHVDRPDGSVAWHAVQTGFGRLAGAAEMVERYRWFKALLSELASGQGFDGGVVVLPESVLGPHRSSLDALVNSYKTALQHKKILLLVHADKAVGGEGNNQASLAKDSKRYTMSSVVWAYGADLAASRQVYAARHVVPWPLPSSPRYQAHPEGKPVADLGDWGRVAFAICFEGMLMEHWLRVAQEVRAGGAQRAVGVANLWFLEGRSLRSVKTKQELAFRRGAALAGLPLTLAINVGVS